MYVGEREKVRGRNMGNKTRASIFAWIPGKERVD